MKKILSFAVIFILLFGLAPSSGLTGIRGPGTSAGVVVFDRWHGCTLYSGVFLMYISETNKESLLKYAGQCVHIDAKRVFQPLNPGDGLISEFTYLGSAPLRQSNWGVEIDDLQLKTVPSFKDGDKPSIIIRVVNSGKKDREIQSAFLAPTLLTKHATQQERCGPSDGPSFALITRQNFWSGGDESPRWRGKGIRQGRRYAWTIGKENAFPRTFKLKPGQTKEIRITFDLPEGQYDFLCGYGGGMNAVKSIASNLVAFDVEKKGRARSVKIKNR